MQEEKSTDWQQQQNTRKYLPAKMEKELIEEVLHAVNEVLVCRGSVGWKE